MALSPFSLGFWGKTLLKEKRHFFYLFGSLKFTQKIIHHLVLADRAANALDNVGQVHFGETEKRAWLNFSIVRAGPFGGITINNPMPLRND